MASKVNTKFVVGLSAGMVVVCAGVAATWYFLIHNNPTDLAKTGDRLMSEQKFEEAAEVYSKAVFKQQTNVAYLTKWIDALGKSSPTSETKYSELFNKMISAKRALAMVQDDAVPAQREYLQIQLDMLQANPYRAQGWTLALQDAQSILTKYATQPPGAWEVLKRYSGMIATRMYFETEGAKQEQLDGALADLEAALRADPKDFESAATMVDVKTRLAEREYKRDAVEAGDKLLAEGDAIVQTFLAANPNDPGMVLVQIQRDLTNTLKRMVQQGSGADPEAIGRDFNQRNVPLLDRAFELAKQLPQPVPSRLLAQMRNGENLVDPSARLRRTEDLMRLAIAARPSHAEAKIALAQVLVERGENSEALEQLAGVRSMATPPISLDGMNLFVQRQTALALQARWAIKVWERAQGAERDAALAQAKDLRAQLAAAEPDGARLAIVDAQLAVVEGTPAALQRAAQLLDRYNKDSRDQDVEALLLTAQVAIRNNQLGLAEETLQKAVSQQGNNIGAMLALAEIKSRLQNYEQAAEVYRMVLRLDKDNEQALRGLEVTSAIAGQTTASTDPVVNALVQLDKLSDELTTDPQGPQKVIDAARSVRDKHPDPRTYNALISAILRTGDKDAALVVVREGLQKFPDNTMLKSQEQVITAGSPLQAALLQADAMPGSELDKTIVRSQIYRNVGDRDKANAELEKAIALDPNDRRVVELIFVRALGQRDFVKAKELTDRAVRENLDGMSGDTYKARLLSLEGKHADAVNVLQEAAKRGGTQPELFRMLGSELATIGRNNEAAEALRTALRARPNDVDAANQLVTTLALAGQMDEALATARTYRKFGENDPNFLNTWLTVESQVGNRDEALAMRERFAKMMPDNRPNKIALASMLADRGGKERAAALVGELRAQGDGLDVAILDADIAWRQGERTKATETLSKFFASQTSVKPADAASITARFLAERGDVVGAIATLEAARESQDKAQLPIDRLISDLQLRTGNAAKAIEASRRIIDAKADTADRFHEKRVAELLVRTGKVDEADAMLKALALSAPDVTVQLLQADVHALRGDQQALRDTLNDAVAKHPESSMAFLRRAQVFMQDKERLRDALADASKAVDLAPESVQALRVRAGVHSLMDNPASAVADIRAAIRLAPQDGELLFGSVAELLRADRDQDAQDLASEAISKRPRDQQLFANLSAIFANSNRYDAARRYLRQAYDVDTNNVAIGQAYLDVQLNNPAPDVAEAQRVLTALEKLVPTSPGLQMSLAKVRMQQGRVPEAARMAQDALKVVDGKNSTQLGAWYTDLNRMFTDKAQVRALLETASRGGQHTDWMTFFRGVNLAESGGALRTEGIALLDQAARMTQNKELQSLALRTKGVTHYQLEQHPQAVEAWKASLALTGPNADLLNNTAYVLAKHLGKADEALPMAQQAAQLSATPEVLDTLGVVYLMQKNYAQAVPPLERSMRSATQLGTAINAGLHLAEAHLGLQAGEKAKETLGIVQQLVDNPASQVTLEQKSQLQELRTKAGMP